MKEKLKELAGTDANEIYVEQDKKEVPEALKLPIEAINDVELEMLRELMADDIAIYKYALDRYSSSSQKKN